ncbi:unnamed protein product [Natator depressus]
MPRAQGGAEQVAVRRGLRWRHPPAARAQCLQLKAHPVLSSEHFDAVPHVKPYGLMISI